MLATTVRLQSGHRGEQCHVGRHVTVGDRAYISGAVGVHQFCRIGALAMVGGQARVTKDVPPFVTVDGQSTKLVGLNLVGLRRNGFDLDSIRELKAAYRVAFRSGLRWSEMLDKLSEQFPSGPGRELAEFMRATERGCVPERATPKSATIRLFEPTDAAAQSTRGVA